MKRQIFFFLVLFLVSCSPLNRDVDDGDRGGDDREGEVDEPTVTDEDLAGLDWLELLKNCKPEIDTPDNLIDIGVSMLPESWQKYYVPGTTRKCAKAKIEEVHNKLCKAREDLERKRRRASGTKKASLTNKIHQLDEQQWKFNQQLRKLAERFDNQLVTLEGQESRRKNLGRVANFIGQEESQAWRDILDVQSYSECNSYSDDDD